jgi:hypothetical protein
MLASKNTPLAEPVLLAMGIEGQQFRSADLVRQLEITLSKSSQKSGKT